MQISDTDPEAGVMLTNSWLTSKVSRAVVLCPPTLLPPLEVSSWAMVSST